MAAEIQNECYHEYTLYVKYVFNMHSNGMPEARDAVSAEYGPVPVEMVVEQVR